MTRFDFFFLLYFYLLWVGGNGGNMAFQHERKRDLMWWAGLCREGFNGYLYTLLSYVFSSSFQEFSFPFFSFFIYSTSKAAFLHLIGVSRN